MNEITVKNKDSGEVVNVSEHNFDSEREFLEISLDGELEKGARYTVKLDFEASLDYPLRGFFASGYTNGDGERT